MNTTLRNVVKGTIWGINAKIGTAALNVISIPLLIKYFGKDNYGLIALVISTNAFLQILNMGVPTGAVKFFSEWRSKQESKKIENCSQSSIVFFGAIGAINALILLTISWYAREIFNIPTEKVDLYRQLIFLVSVSSFINWLFVVTQHILTAYEDVAWLQKINLMTSVVKFAAVVISINCKLGLVAYFIIYLASNLMAIPPYLHRMKHHGLNVRRLLKPKWHGHEFKTVMNYSILLFVMSIFIYLGDHFRPLLLVGRATTGLKAVADFSILQTIVTTIAFIGTIALQPLLPAAAKAISEDDTRTINRIVGDGTKYLTNILTLSIVVTMVSAVPILRLYVGNDYVHLAKWLVLGLLALFGMHNQAISSYILAKGNVRPLAICTSAASIGSLAVVILLAPYFDVGAAVLAFLAYKIIEMLFVYCWYLPRFTDLNSRRIFIDNVAPSLMLGALTYIGTSYVMKALFSACSDYVCIVIATAIVISLHAGLTLSFVIKPVEARALMSSLLGGKNHVAKHPV